MTTPTALLPSGTWTLDPNTSVVTATVKKMKLITVPATFDVISGTISIADGNVASVSVAVDAASYTSGNTKRNEHVISDDFLDAQNHPTIEFTAGAATDTERISGNVTSKGTTSPVVFHVTDLRIDDEAATFKATATVNRAQLGITKMPGLVISNDITVDVTASAKLQR